MRLFDILQTIPTDQGPRVVTGYDSNMIEADRNRLSRWTIEYGLKPCAIAGCFVFVALLWTFPLQHVIAYPFVFSSSAPSWAAPGLAASSPASWPFLFSLYRHLFLRPALLFDGRGQGFAELSDGIYRVCNRHHGGEFREKASGERNSECPRSA